MEENADLGRHLVASRRIATGEEVLREAPLVSGPLQVTPPVCLGCYSLLTELGSIECPKCGWPMCSLNCAKTPQHHPECKITSQCRGTKVRIFQEVQEWVLVVSALVSKVRVWFKRHSLKKLQFGYTLVGKLVQWNIVA